MSLNDFLEEAIRNVVVAAATKDSNLNTIQRVMPLLKHGDKWYAGHVLNSNYKVIVLENGHIEYVPIKLNMSQKYPNYITALN